MPLSGTETREQPKLAQKRAHSVRNSRVMADARLSLRSLVALCTMPSERLQALARLLPQPPLSRAERAWIQGEEAVIEHYMNALDALVQRREEEEREEDRQQLMAYVAGMDFVSPVRALRLC